MNVPPEPNATKQGDKGESIDPSGEEGERVPICEVGEYWPLVRP